MRLALVVVVVVACNGGEKPTQKPAGAPATVFADAAVAAVSDAAPMTWRGPNLYQLVAAQCGRARQTLSWSGRPSHGRP